MKKRYRKRNREYEDDFTRGSSSFWFLKQQKFPRMSDEHGWKTCMSDEHAWKTSKLEKRVEKNQACLKTCVVSFFEEKK